MLSICQYKCKQTAILLTKQLPDNVLMMFSPRRTSLNHALLPFVNHKCMKAYPNHHLTKQIGIAIQISPDFAGIVSLTTSKETISFYELHALRLFIIILVAKGAKTFCERTLVTHNCTHIKIRPMIQTWLAGVLSSSVNAFKTLTLHKSFYYFIM